MRHIPFDPERDLSPEQRIWWDAWMARADAARDDYVAKRLAGEDPPFRSEIWKELKDWLSENVFFGKCAYCEFDMEAGFYGEAEHYRPKGNVTVPDDSGTKQRVTCTGGAEHPGYYWLAYDWRNLVPSCSKCNNTKSDQFPVKGAHAMPPAPDWKVLTEQEDPLLLHPYFDEIDKHIRFGKFGRIVAIDGDPHGVATIRTFGLDRTQLTEKRWERQDEVFAAMARELLESGLREEDVAKVKERWIGKRTRFSAAVRAYYQLRYPDLVRALDVR